MKRRVMRKYLTRQFNRFLTVLLTGVLLLACATTPLSLSAAETDVTDDGWPAGPSISGDGAIVIDADTGIILYEKNIYDRFYPASTTKVLTTLVALENSELNEIVTVSYAADNYVSKTSSRMGLVEGEQITMEQALYGIMLESANEATYAVGEHVGGSIARFIKMMNWKAQSLGCERSHFANSHGLHDEDHYTCSYDLSLIARAAYANEDFMKITGTATYWMPQTNKNDEKLLTNHHWFLNGTKKYDYCIGGKTGATNQAGYALVTYARKDGLSLISVVMHAPTWDDVYADSLNLLEFCFNNFKVYDMKDVSNDNAGFEAVQTLPSPFSDEDLFDEDMIDILSTGMGGSVILPDSITPDETVREVILEPGRELGNGDNVIGKVTYSYGDRVVGSADIVYYNSENPMTQQKFDKNWPNFLIPLDVVFSDLDSRERIKPGEIPKTAVQIPEETRPLTIALCIAGGALILGIITILVVRKRRL